MFGVIKRLPDSPQLEKIAVIFTLMTALRIFSFAMCLEDLTFRLPRGIVPIHYVLQLHPDFSSALFSGEVTITVYAFNVTRFIAVHAKYLRIESAILSKVKMNATASTSIGEVKLKRLFAVDEHEMLVIETTTAIAIGYYNLEFKFSGTMDKSYKGFFMMSFNDRGSNKTSQFEPTYARYAFPCFDEPRLKAIFDIKLVQPDIEKYTSLSNMPIQHSQRGSPVPGLMTVYFQRTPPISTYQIALTVTDLVNETAFIAKRWDPYSLIPLRAWTTSDKTISLDLVLHVTYRALELYMNLFGLNYPLPKYDMVAVPGFSKDPVVNWGLVLHNEPSMLFYARSNSIDDLKIATNRITYGIIHAWFGCLVTMSWWNDAWLIKSFATYMQYYTINKAFPDWKAFESFLLETKYPSMGRDGLVSSLPILQPTGSTVQVGQFVNSIFRNKGASIIRMLCHMLGEKQFFFGVASFLHAYKFNTATMREVVSAIQRYHGGREDLNRFVDTWIKQPGFPILNIKRIGNVYYITQSRFFCNNDTIHGEINSPYLHKWDVPIFYATNISNGTKKMFLPYDAAGIKLQVNDKITWVKFNTNSIGFFSTNYDLQTWQVFSDVLRNNPQELRDLDRADLINDAFLNAEAGRIPYTVPMKMIEYMRLRPSHMLWQLLFDKLITIHTKLWDTEISTHYEVFIRKLINPIYSWIGWEIHHLNSYKMRRLRTVVLKMACTVRLEDCVKEVTEKFRFWISRPDVRPHPDIKEVVYYYGMLNAGEKKDWDVVYNLFVNEPQYGERCRLMNCLTAIRNSTILINYLEMAKDPSIMSNEEYLRTFSAAVSNPLDPVVVWNFYKTNWNFLKSRYSDNDDEFVRLIVSVTSKFRDHHLYHEIERFFKEHPCGKPSVAARYEALELVRNNIFWMKQNYHQIKNFLLQ